MTHTDFIKCWPTTREFANAIGVSENTAKGIRHRGSIPGWYWLAMAEDAKKRGYKEITLRKLAIAAAEQRLLEK